MAGEAITKTIESGKKKQIATRTKGIYRFQVIQGTVRLSDNKTDISNGERAVPGDRGRIQLESGDELWVKNTGLNDAKIEVKPQGLKVDFFSNSKLEVTDKVFPGVETDSIQASNDGETLNFKDQEIPQGAQMAVKTPSTNNGDVLINGEVPLGSRGSFAISNMSAVDLQFESSGDKAFAVVEVDN